MIDWLDVLVGAFAGVVAQALFELMFPGPSVILSLVKWLLPKSDRSHLP